MKSYLHHSIQEIIPGLRSKLDIVCSVYLKDEPKQEYIKVGSQTSIPLIKGISQEFKPYVLNNATASNFSLY